MGPFAGEVLILVCVGHWSPQASSSPVDLLLSTSPSGLLPHWSGEEWEGVEVGCQLGGQGRGGAGGSRG